MKVTVFGGWYSGRSGFECTGSLSEFATTGRAIGRLLSTLGHRLIITSNTERTLDSFVAEGFLKASADSSRPPSGSELTIVLFGPDQADTQYGEGSDAAFNELISQYGEFISFVTAPGRLRFSRHFAAIGECDAAIILGGADHTFLAGRVARVAQKIMVPLGGSGGAGRELLEEGLRLSRQQDGAHSRPTEARLRRLFAPWSEGVERVLRDILTETPVAIVHGRSPDWQSLRNMLDTVLSSDIHRYRPVLMNELEVDSEALPYKWERAGSMATAAIALITPDDVGALDGSSALSSRARQNVWLEVGWMWGRLGRSRLLLLVQGDVEVPSDLQGIEYHTYEGNLNECHGRIAAFLARLHQ
ncbi:TIR domain-containing protein [Myceligenerans pegani]|uniref:Nucleotide-binding protein n=1 Tax=Myceligenerans pegani TaxID=2776917 RepID=A0ABR9N1K6_9MICO|nr:TIR domain-containing protein [Myceligenerans sp. TRM 65318]MBE1877166.1 nucleotide-binding protein [Myceligenerans sp. TRM 65318]MBE3019437.1 nucleotide-binding protein [Myceligenerans sp. TRM 65318]